MNRAPGSTRGGWRSAAFDAALALNVAAFDVVLTVRVWHLDTAYSWSVLGCQLLADLALVLRRRAPLGVLAAVGVAALLQLVPMLVAPGWMWPTQADPVWVVVPLSTPFAAYATIVYGRHRRAGWALIAVLTLVGSRPWQPYGGVMAVGLNMTVIPALAGISVAARRRMFQALAERAERAEREQHLLAVQARADERARLAREMHDVVTHRVSLMVLQAGALRMAATDDRVRGIAEDLRTAGCQALEELRDFVGVLRSPSAAAPNEQARSDAPPVALPDLDELVEQTRSLGTTVAVRQTGDPLLISPAVARTAYRVVQEALTNARKHAPGAPVSLDLRYDADRVRLLVADTGPRRPPDPELTGSGSGSGLYGLAQRVELVRGTLRVGAGPKGGFRVEATLPAYVPTEPGAHVVVGRARSMT